MAVLGRQGWAPLTVDSDHLPRVVAASKTLAIAAPKVVVTTQLNRWAIHHFD